MADSNRDISSLIVSTPGVCGGRPCLAGTRFPILELAVHYNAGETAEEVAAAYDLPLDGVYAGYAYYLANRSAIDADLADEARVYAEGLATSQAGRERASA
jgi:uncharacterized protein (DUF433 family)